MIIKLFSSVLGEHGKKNFGWAYILPLLKCRHWLVSWGVNLKSCMYVTHLILHATWLVESFLYLVYWYIYKERKIENSKHRHLVEIFLKYANMRNSVSSWILVLTSKFYFLNCCRFDICLSFGNSHHNDKTKVRIIWLLKLYTFYHTR